MEQAYTNLIYKYKAYMQREPSVKTLHFPFSAEFSRNCLLSGGTQRRALSIYV